MLLLRFFSIYLAVFILTLIALINNITPYQAEEGEISWIELMAWIIFGALIMYIAIKSRFKRIFIKSVETFVVFFSTYLLLSMILSPFPFLYFLTIFLSFLVAFLRIMNKFRNEIAVISSSGVAAYISLFFDPLSSLLFMFFLAIYDYLAVFKTKHMQVLAKGLAEEQSSFSIKEKAQVEYKGEVRTQSLEMGSGDLLVPSLIAGAFFKLGIVYSLSVILGTFVGFIALAYVLEKYRKMLPAIPFLFLGILFSLAITYLLDFLIV